MRRSNIIRLFVVYLIDVGQRLLVLDQHLGKLQTLVCINTHHISQQKHPVWRVAHLQMYKCIKMQFLSQHNDIIQTHL